ncbi:hypothetical protein C8Q74DRAFT_408228 [Fomes fomentarius]|nr:hypothetical protein C8Q74DRAFT_408228 [Fomes fomentarius]
MLSYTRGLCSMQDMSRKCGLNKCTPPRPRDDAIHRLNVRLVKAREQLTRGSIKRKMRATCIMRAKCTPR